ncbi:uncharacterized protein A1O5_08531 [Cladophialophora psammophila CBS 110553]|uniref:SnoaL-like domain-containing protein n=1 Tax=Cladophialophora psammophila CBS 110553 TaxID=1182543 RepID=W9WKQ7_9EURO|nr:uncharacterized protein A1O5_08531 [Cladophialophora psammophila CBS 110553]EXJ68737.1 hypothetical protein A1O5_08531 [Cladophialophora psammophila CBS 110553]
MSFPTKPAFVYAGNWGDETRKHPAMKWMEDYTRFVDDRNFDKPFSEWHTEDSSFHKADGTVVSGGAEAWKEAEKTFSIFTSFLHRPYFVMCTETENGWEAMAQAHFYANMVGQPAAGEKKVTDPEGNAWDIVVPAGFHFEYVRDGGAIHDGLLLKRNETMLDTWPIMQVLIKRGEIKME